MTRLVGGPYGGPPDGGLSLALTEFARSLDDAREEFVESGAPIGGDGVSTVVQALSGALAGLDVTSVRETPVSSVRAQTGARTLGRAGARRWFEIRNRVAAGTAEVHVYGDVGEGGVTAAEFIRELAGIAAGAITVRINSGGGQVFDGLAIHNALRSHPARVTVYVDALAASIASVIAMAGDWVIMRGHSQLMIHDARNWLGDSSPKEMREYADFLDRQSDNLADVYVRKAGGTRAQWRERMRQDTWYSAEEAVAAGLADEVQA